MSWEWTTREDPCPCGKGISRIEWGSNDWGQSDEKPPEMLCDECRPLYVYAPLRNRADRSWGWIPRVVQEAREAERRAEREREATATEEARVRLTDGLVQALAPIRARKAVWEALRDADCRSRCLGSFAAFNRMMSERGREATIREFIDSKNESNLATFVASRAR